MRYCYKCSAIYKYGESALNHACDPIEVVRVFTQSQEFRDRMKDLIKDILDDIKQNEDTKDFKIVI